MSGPHGKHGLSFVVPWVVIILLGAARPVLACTPIVPLMQLFAGQLIGVRSLTMLAVVIVVKSLIFTYFVRECLALEKAVIFMIIANIVSTIIGFLMSGMIAGPDPDAGALILPIVYFLALLPAKRLVKHDPWGYFRRWNPWLLAFMVLLMFILSILLFGVSQSFDTGERSMVTFWIMKFLYVYLAITISFGLTSIWEEWTIAALTRPPDTSTNYLVPVFKANLIMYILVLIHPATTSLITRLSGRPVLWW